MKILIPLITIALSAVGCSTITVNHRYDETEDFSKYLTYAWMPEAKPSGNLPFDEPTVNRRVTRAVEQELHFKGLRKTDVADADFLIGYQVALDRQLTANEVATHYEFNDSVTDPALIGTVQTESTTRPLSYIRSYEQGTLILSIADAYTKELIWWSSSQAEVRATDPADIRKKRIHKAVGKMLQTFPPK